MIEKIKQFMAVHKKTVILIATLAILTLGGYLLFQKFSQPVGPAEEVDLPFDAEGPYALLYPRRDGNALILNIKRTSSYDNISYDLSYASNPDEIVVSGNKVSEDGESNLAGGSIDRGVSGSIDTKDKKGEYEQEILFGTCSKNVCKYDKGVENGTLTLKIKKGNKLFKMITQWHLQKPDVALGILTSGDGHFIYKMAAEREKLATVGFTIINDLSGAPKLPQGMEVLGKVYAVNASITKDLPEGEVVLELAENPPDGAKLFRFDGSSWQELETKIEGSKLSSQAAGSGIFAVLIPKK